MAQAIDIKGMKEMKERITQSEFDKFIKSSIDSWLANVDIEYRDHSFLQMFRGKDLSGLNMRLADLKGMDLSGCDLRGANLYGALLSGACLREADLRWANLCEASFDMADLYAAKIYGANLCGTCLREAKNIPFIPMACPESGEFTAYKKAELRQPDFSFIKHVVVELKIPAHAMRSSATTRKCRCDMASVLKVYDLDKTEIQGVEATSMYDPHFKYTPGGTVVAPDFDTNRWNECSTGIHFFMSFQEAVEY